MITPASMFSTRLAAASSVPLFALDLENASTLYTTGRLFDYATEMLARTPVFWWRLGESSGSTLSDSSGNARHLTITGSPTMGVTGLLSGDSDKAFRLPGATTGTYASKNSCTFPTGDLTFLCLAKWTSFGTSTTLGAAIFSYAYGAGTAANEFVVMTSTSGELIVYVNGTNTVSTAIVATGTTYHIAITWVKSTGATKIYVNGAEAASFTLSAGATLTSGGTVVLGQDQDTLGGGFDSTQAPAVDLDEVAVINSALSAASIKALYETSIGLYSMSGAAQYLSGPPSMLTTQVDTRAGTASTGTTTVTLLDRNDDITEVLRPGVRATIKTGFLDLCYSDFLTVFEGVVDGIRLSRDLTSYEVTLRSAQSPAAAMAFDVASSPLAAALGSGDTVAYLSDARGFQSSGVVRVEDELITYSGVSSVAGRVLPEYAWQSLNYGQSKWVAVGLTIGTSKIAFGVSADGKNWDTILTTESGVGAGGYPVVYAPEINLWIAACGSGFVMTSPDGYVWTKVTVSLSSLSGIAWSPSLSLLALTGASGTLTSPDGVTFTSRTDTSGTRASICWDETNAKFATGPSYSTDGVTWSASGSGAFAAVGMKANATGRIVAVGTNIVKTSDDGGQTWTSRTSPANNQWHGVASDGGSTWVVVAGYTAAASATNAIYVSTDNGVNWSSATSPSSSQWYDAAYGAGMFALSAFQLYSASRFAHSAYSTDSGVTWSITQATLTGLTRGVDLSNLTTSAAAHAIGAVVGEVIRLGPAHPIDIVEGVLTDAQKSGIGLSADLVDSEKLAALKSEMGENYQMEFLVSAPQSAKEFIEQEICAPLGLFPAISAKFALGRVAGGTSVATLTNDDILEVVGFGQQIGDVVNAVSVQYDFNLITGAFGVARTTENAFSISSYGRRPIVIQATGLKSSLDGTPVMIDAAASNIIDRNRHAPLRLTIRCHLSKLTIEPGDVVQVTSSLLPRPSYEAAASWVPGSRGLSAFEMQVVRRDISWADMSVTFELESVG